MVKRFESHKYDDDNDDDEDDDDDDDDDNDDDVCLATVAEGQDFILWQKKLTLLLDT